MRFASFAFPQSMDPEMDSVVIDDTLREIELAEEMGFDAVFLNEHHFDGASAFADPLVFGAAVAASTSRVKIGFAVVEMALHHPIRLATQTALLDNLSHGRLIVGTGRGSAYNHYEYLGFGTTMQRGMDSLLEAEELLVKAWTGEDVRHEGKFWKVSFPRLRPRPYQKPHPPLVRACLSDESVAAMARIGRPILTSGYNTPDSVGRRLDLYRDTMAESGFDETAVEEALDQTWVNKMCFVSESYDEALDIASAAFERDREHIRIAREKWNPEGESAGPIDQSTDVRDSFMLGTPGQVSDQVAELRDAGVRNQMLVFNVGQMEQRHVQSSIRLFGEKVLPLFK